MSSLSRLSFLSLRLASKRYQIALPARAAVLPQPLLRFNTSFARNNNRSNEFVENVTGMNSQSGMKRILRDLNDQVQRAGRVSLKTIQEAVAQAQAIGFLKGVETQFLLRATGSFLKEADAVERDKLREKIWNLAKKDELDISHYNTLLYIKLENGTSFDPLDFLQELSGAGVAANRVTYQRLVQRYCQIGDVQNATKIIEFMKAQDLAISEKVFHALITGHLRAGEPEKARNVIGIMKNANVAPTAETYVVLSEGLAEQGAIADAIDAVCDQKLMEHHILSIAKTVAMRDDLSALERVLALMPEHGFRDYSVLNTCLELIVAKKLDAALLIWQQLKEFLPRKNSGNLIPIQMMKRGYPIDDVVRVCEQFRNDGMGDTIFLEVARNALYSGDRAVAEEYLEKLHSIGHPIRPHYFLPLLCLSSNDAQLFAALKRMTEKGHQPLLEFLVDIILPKLDSSDVNKLFANLEQAGVTSPLAASAVGIHLLLQKRMEDSEKFLVGQSSAVNCRRLATLLGPAFNAKNMASAINILSSLVDKAHADSAHIDVVGIFLENAGGNTDAAIEALAKTRLPISSISVNRLKGAGYNVEPLSGSGNVKDFRNSPQSFRSHNDMSKEELESQTLQLEGQRLNIVLRRLLNHYCKDRDVAKVNEILKKLSETELNGANFACLTELHTNLGEVDRALEFYRKLTSYPDFHIDSYKIFALTEALVAQKRWTEAFAILTEQADHMKNSLETFNAERGAGRLLTTVYQHYGKEKLFEAYEDFISPLVDSRAFGPLIKALSETDGGAAFDVFQEVVHRYRSSPYKKLVGKRLITENRTDDLDTFISILSSLIGTLDCAMELALCYIECEKVDEAKEMLLRCGGRRGKANLIKACNTYVNDGKFDKLEALLKLLEDIGIEKDVVAFYRIKLYNQSNDVEKALEVWTHAQEENTVLFPVALDMLAKLLERNGQPVPFLVPERQSLYGNARFTASKFHDILEESLEKALEYRAQLKEENRQLTSRETCSLIHELINHDRVEEAFSVVQDIQSFNNLDVRQKTTLSRLVGVAAEKKLTERLEELYEHSGRTIGSNAVQRSYMNAEKIAEYLEKLESKPAEEVRFFLSSELLKADAAIGARLEKLSERIASEANVFSGVAQLWFLHIVHSETGKAQQLLIEFPAMEAFLEKFRIQPSIEESFDCGFFSRLLQVTHNQSIITRAFLRTLHNLTRENRIDEANECLRIAKQNSVDTSKISSALLKKMGQSTGSEMSSNVDESQLSEKIEVRSS